MKKQSLQVEQHVMLEEERDESTMVKLGHSKTTRVVQVINPIKVLILMLLGPQIENRTTPKTAQHKKKELLVLVSKKLFTLINMELK